MNQRSSDWGISMSGYRQRSRRTRLLATGALLAAILGVVRLEGQFVISEFLASNREFGLDDQGLSSDWVEICNVSKREASLEGWFLSDDPNQLAKWRLPALTVAPLGFRVVYCSGLNRVDPAAPLHAEFKLTRSGEFLALVEPDGATIAWQFAPFFPSQLPDVSYGFAQRTRELAFVSSRAEGRVFVPADDSLGARWTELGFDDAAWTAGPTAFGFDQKTTPTFRDEIATDIGAAMRRLNASAYVRIPFQLESTSGFDLLALRVKYEDGFIAYLNGVEIARAKAPTPALWNSGTAPQRQDNAAAKAFELFDATAFRAQLRVGANVLAVHAMNDTAQSADFFVLPELVGLVVEPLATDQPRYFDRPTPGWPNGEGFPAVSRPPLFSKAGGTLLDPLSLELTPTTPGAGILYTVDGKEPIEGVGKVYSGALTITSTTIVKARALEPGLLPSETATQTYFLLQRTLANVSSNLPLVLMTTFGQPIAGTAATVYTPVQWMSFETKADGRAAFADAPSLQGRGGLRIRGSSSAGFPKNNYAFETWDIDNEDLDMAFLGFSPDSDWVLLGPYTDKTLMRDVLAFQWSNAMGRWAPKTRFFELYLSAAVGPITSTHYIGVYALVEKITVGPHRVDIVPLLPSHGTAPEIDGGYLLKHDRIDPGDAGFQTSRVRTNMAFHEPEEKELTAAQRSYIISYLNTFEAALYGANFRDPAFGYNRYLDVDSWIDLHILVELTKNIDGYRLSTFFYKDRGGKLVMGPAWDYNLSLGNANYLDGWKPDGWYYRLIGGDDYPWYPRLFEDPAFKRRYSERWADLRETVFKESTLLADIDRLAALLAESQARNYQRWRILGTYVWPNPLPDPPTYEGQIAFMKNWLSQRLAWMDGQLTVAPEFSPPGGMVEAGLTVSITAPKGTIHYTSDGSDPRAPNGAPAPSSQVYAGQPVLIERNTLLRARVLIGGGTWSEPTEAAYIVSIPSIALTEIMYNPTGGTEYQFLEVANVGAEVVDLLGASFTRGVVFEVTDAANSKLAPGEHGVFVRNAEVFASRYDVAAIKVLGVFRGSLHVRSEAVLLQGPVRETIFEVTYRSLWHPQTDGQGHSLVLVDPLSPRGTWSDNPASWRACLELNGSPGRADGSMPPGSPQVPGDLSQDGRLSFADTVRLLSYLFRGGVQLPCGDGGVTHSANVRLLDADGDSSVAIADAIRELQYLFVGGPPHVLGVRCVRLADCPAVCAP